MRKLLIFLLVLLLIFNGVVFADSSNSNNDKFFDNPELNAKRAKYITYTTADIPENGEYIEMTLEEYKEFVRNFGGHDGTIIDEQYANELSSIGMTTESISYRTIKSNKPVQLGAYFNVEQVIVIYSSGSFGQITEYIYSPPRTYLSGVTFGISLSDKAGYSVISGDGQSIYVNGSAVIHYSILIEGLLEIWSENVTHSFNYHF